MWFTQYSLPIFVPDAFEKWLISVINAPFLERKFFDILSMINSHSDKPTIRRLFTKIISIFHETELIIKNDDFIQNQLQIILNELPQWKNTLLDKFYRVIDFAQLLTAVKKTPLLNRNMTHILETYKEIKQILERIKSDQNREEARLSLDSALDGTILKKLAGTE